MDLRLLGPCMLALVHPCEVGARRTEFILETLDYDEVT